MEASILRLPELIKHTTMCYMHSGLSRHSPLHISRLWKEREQSRENLRDRGKQLDYPVNPKQWVNDLSPIAQAKLWNNTSIDKSVEPATFKSNSKYSYMTQYDEEIRQNPELYKDYLENKKNEKKFNQIVTNKNEDCILL